MCVDARPIFIRDGAIATSGGVTAALDLTLAFVEEDHGPEIARRVALGMVTYLQRPGNQAQMSMFTTLRRPEQTLVRQVFDHVMSHLDADLGATRSAALVGVCERHLSRLFAEHIGRMGLSLAAMPASTQPPGYWPVRANRWSVSPGGAGSPRQKPFARCSSPATASPRHVSERCTGR